MKNDYKIIYKDSHSIYVDIMSLSPGLSANCEIFKGDFKGDDLYVGSTSHKSLVYIAHNIAKHTYEKYNVRLLDDPGSYYCRDYIDFELCIERSILENLRYINGIFGIFPHLAEEEMVKRGQVAIDYLKSGKHLFRS
jgi:hypothetical protein